MNMQTKIITVRLPLPFHMGWVNCYLIETDSGYFLIDTGVSNSRKELLKELERAGCKPGLLTLILLTHGDFDHIGNAAYLREAFGSKIAMHADDLGMAERGDMFASRHQPNALIRAFIPLFAGIVASERFSPDLLLQHGDDLSPYGIEAQVISIPGHSKGSIGILLASGELFCGDLFSNGRKPALNSLMDDPSTGQASLARLKALDLHITYPGHGPPFAMEALRMGGTGSMFQ